MTAGEEGTGPGGATGNGGPDVSVDVKDDHEAARPDAAGSADDGSADAGAGPDAATTPAAPPAPPPPAPVPDDDDLDLSGAVIVSHDDPVQAVDLGLVGPPPGAAATTTAPPGSPTVPPAVPPSGSPTIPPAVPPSAPGVPPAVPGVPPAGPGTPSGTGGDPDDPPLDPVLAAQYRQVAAGAAASAAVAAASASYEIGDPATTMLRLNPGALAAHRRRERRRTLTFLGIFLGVLLMGVAAFTFFQGAWAWPFGDDTPAARPCPVVAPSGVAPDEVSVRVYNATTRKGLALNVSKGLSKRDFVIEAVGNDPLEAKVKAAAIIRHGPAGLAAAKTVAAQIDGKVTLEDDGRLSQAVDLVLGSGYKKLSTVEAAAEKLAPATAPSPAGCVPVPASSPEDSAEPSPSASTEG